MHTVESRKVLTVSVGMGTSSDLNWHTRGLLPTWPLRHPRLPILVDRPNGGGVVGQYENGDRHRGARVRPARYASEIAYGHGVEPWNGRTIRRSCWP